MKGTGNGIWQATIGSSVDATAGTTGQWTVPTCLQGGGTATTTTTGWWIKVSTTVDPIIVNKSRTFSISNVIPCVPGNLSVLSNVTGAEIDARDTSGALIFNSTNTPFFGKTTNFTFHFVMPTAYKVKVSKSCYYNVDPVSVTVLPGGKVPQSATVRLLPIQRCENGVSLDPYGSIKITSLPDEGYQVYLDDVDMGYRTPILQDIGTGNHKVTLKTFGYIDQDKTVEVTAGGTVRADFILEPEEWLYNPVVFSSPIDMPPVVNTAKVGQTIPVKFHVSTMKGNVNLEDKYQILGIRSYPVSCGEFIRDPTDAVTEVTTGGTELQYKGNGDWQYNWKIPKTYTGTEACRNMYIQFTNDQKSQEASFKFK